LELNNEILSNITVFNKYAKYVPELKRRETWEELVTRNINMHIKKFPQVESKIRAAYELVYAKKVLPSMRSLQFGGRPIELANNRIYNCAYLPLDHMDAFSELMFLLLGGTGGGYSVQRHHTECLPVVLGALKETRRFLVGDSIEGWADAIKVLVEAHFLGKQKPIFDLRDIREKGAALITTGGKAPGPAPLEECINRLEVILKRNVGNQMEPLEIHDMVCIIADAVLAGGIRRAALICLFDRDDEALLDCKGNFEVEVGNEFLGMVELTLNGREYLKSKSNITSQLGIEHTIKGSTITVPWWFLEPQRGRSNNSAVLPRGKVSHDEFLGIMQRVQDSGSGEPGVYWTSNVDYGTNPCCEIALKPNQFCNLCEVNVSDIESQDDLNSRVEAASFIGTLQAGYTDFHYLRPVWKQTTQEEALIGVSMTGIGSGEILQYDLREAAQCVLRENEVTAKLLGINPTARATTVKPAGTSSLVLGSSSGIHAWHNDYYIRRMRCGRDEALYQYMLETCPELVEDDEVNPSQAVLSFPQKAPERAILRHESASDLLERVRKFNLEWVRAGHNSGDNTHNVSCTISVKDDEWPSVIELMWSNRNDYNGIAVLPYHGGTYPQMPFEDIDEATFDVMNKALKGIDLTKVIEVADNTEHSQEAACSGGKCEL